MTFKSIKQLDKEIEIIVRESKYKMGMSHIDSRKIKELEAQISQSKSICEMIEEKKKDSKKLIKEVSKHRCRAKTGNWCLDCERLNSEATGIFNTCEEILAKIKGEENDK